MTNTAFKKEIVLWVVTFVSFTAFCKPIKAQDDRFANSPVLPGLKATYTGSDGKTHTRLDYQLAFHWRDRSPDPRIPAGPFRAQWQGRVFTKSAGEYTFHIYVAGKVRLKVANKILLDAESAKSGWLKSKPIKLQFGRHPIEVVYQSAAASPHFALFWSGPDFDLEPVAQRWLWHDREKQSIHDFQTGRRLVRALRCAGCHDIPGERKRLSAPALDTLTGNLQYPWLVQRLCDHPPKKLNDTNAITHRMPHYALPRSEAEAVAAFLLSTSANKNSTKTKGDKAAGKTLFFTTGCIACHTVNGVGANGLFGGGDLTAVAEKRPTEFFQKWLADPAKVNRHHRMPVFEFSKKQQADLAAFMTTLHGEKAKPAKRAKIDPQQIKQGKQLVTKYRCHACHEIPGFTQDELPHPSLTLRPTSNWDGACIGAPNAQVQRPGYNLNERQTKAVREYITSLTSVAKKPSAKLDGAMVLAERNCVSCHSRGWSLGMSDHLLTIRQAHPELASELAAVSPPSLESVGDKFQDKTLRTAVIGKLPRRRPWLSIQMPRFPLSNAEADALVRYFIDVDRIPKTPNPSSKLPNPKKLDFAGRRLVGAGGFSCVSCHKVGKAKPKGVAPNVLGPELSMLGKLVREEWFHRFTRNPLRTGLAMEMPSLTVPAANILNDDLDHQLAAVWQVLNKRGFTPPQQALVRIVRHTGADAKSYAHVLTDVLHAGERVMIRPFVIGLANRHNILYDLESAHLGGWWMGATAKQWTEGKSWFWTTAGTNLFPITAAEPEVTLISGNKTLAPMRRGPFITEFDSYEHIPEGLRFSHRLHFVDKQSDARATVLRLRQTFLQHKSKDGRRGFRRIIETAGIPSGSAVVVRLAPGETAPVKDSANTAQSVGTFFDSRIHVTSPDNARLIHREKRSYVTLTAGQDGTARCIIEYSTDEPTPQPGPLTTPGPIAKKQQMNVLPGYTATRLPLPIDMMPTALAWRDDGSLFAASLHGQVWLLRDTDRDGLEDAATMFSDELAAPYGLMTNGKSVDVLNKYALLRMTDANGDGRADRVDTVASGWGHTNDYHDWAVGPIRDDNGNYYIAFPCRQDERSKAAAHLRGFAVKLLPRKPTAQNPHPFRIEEFCNGLRFPMGLALSRCGDLFCTDNQGNYNPFNELNHLRKGKHFGFFNRHEPKTNAPLTPPAIDLPHPWTRSVNGLCFLYTPKSVLKKRGSLFGPYEGHLLGCEYNNRSLIRMTLQKVGDTYQGACYPFTVSPKSRNDKFLGPICCAVSPAGDLYIGNMHDSGWSGGQNTGTIVRLRPGKNVPTGIAEVRANRNGFTVLFTAPIERKRGTKLDNYSLSSYRRVSTPAYGGKDVDRRTEKIKSVVLSDGGRTATVTLGELREGFVYELRVTDLVSDEELMHPDEAYYTLRRIPTE